MALLNEAVAAGVQTHITDHDLIARVVNERHGVFVANPAGGQTYAPDMANGETHVVNLPAAGVVTIGAPVSTDPVRAWLPGAELVIVLVTPGGSTATVTWDAAYSAAGPQAVAGQTAVARFRNVTVDASPAVWVPAGAPYGTFVSHVRAQASSATDVASIVKGFAGQSADLTQWQNSAGTVLAKVSSGAAGLFPAVSVGSLTANRRSFDVNNTRAIVGGTTTPATLATLSVLAQAATDVAAVVQGFASQSGDLTQWQNSGGTVLAKVDAAGVLTAAGLATAGVLNVSGGGAHTIVGSLTETGQTLSQPSSAAQVPQVMRGFAAQTADLTQWQNSGGSTLSRIGSDGGIHTSAYLGTPTVTDDAATGTFLSFDGSSVLAIGRKVGSPTLITRAVASQTADMQQWQNSAGAVLAAVTAGGVANLSGISASTSGATAPDGIAATAFLAASTAAARPLVLRGAAGQTGSLLSFQNSSNTPMALVDAAGVGQFPALGIGTAPVGGTQTTIQSLADSTIPLLIEGHSATQSASLQQWWKSGSGPTVASLGANGSFDNSGGGGAIITGGGFYNNSNECLLTGQNGTTQRSRFTDSGGIYFIQTDHAVQFAKPYTSAWRVQINPDSAVAGVPLTVAGVNGQTGDLQDWQNYLGSRLAYVRNDGQIQSGAGFVGGAGTQPIGQGSWGGVVTSTATDPAQAALILKEAASQTQPIMEVQSSAAALLAKVAAAGWMQAVGFYGGTGSDASTARNAMWTTASNVVALEVRGAASQTANLQEWRNSAGTGMAWIGSGGGCQFSTGSFGQSLGTGTLNVWARGAGEVPMVLKLAGSNDVAQFYNSAGTEMSWINSAGTFTTSSQELKRNIRQLDHGLASLLRLRPVRFEWRDAPGAEHLGFISEQVAGVMPELVGYATGGQYPGINQAGLIPPIVNAIRELHERLDRLEMAA